jgi:NitT/TauT family transport system ATP-binding protein
MDEPFGALDAQTRNLMQIEIQEIRRKTRKTILFVTHSVDEAVFLADRIMVLTQRPGRVREIVPVTKCPHPRDRTCSDFIEIRRHVLDLISGGSSD